MQNTLNMQNTRVGICYWGLTRSTRLVADSHHSHIFEPLKRANIPYDIFLHTWETTDPYIWWIKTNSSPDYTEHEILSPTAFQRDSQEEFLNTLDFGRYYYPTAEKEWEPQLIRNHICALESMRRVTALCLSANANNQYTHIIYVRPDARIYTDLPVSRIISMDEHEIILPDENHFEGYNDRFAAMKLNMCVPYGNRINQLAEFREKVGYIVSEKYAKYIIDKHYSPVFCEFKFRLVRPDGTEV